MLLPSINSTSIKIYEGLSIRGKLCKLGACCTNVYRHRYIVFNHGVCVFNLFINFAKHSNGGFCTISMEWL